MVLQDGPLPVINGVITLVIGVIAQVISGRGPPCGRCFTLVTSMTIVARYAVFAWPTSIVPPNPMRSVAAEFELLESLTSGANRKPC